MDAPNDTRPQNTRRKFAAMVGVYFVGTFNDNFCRQGAMLLAVAGGLHICKVILLFLFTLPFIIFAAYAGFLADRFSKRSVVIGVKADFARRVCSSVPLVFIIMSWPIILITIFILGLQATIFSPAINGINSGTLSCRLCRYRKRYYRRGRQHSDIARYRRRQALFLISKARYPMSLSVCFLPRQSA